MDETTRKLRDFAGDLVLKGCTVKFQEGVFTIGRQTGRCFVDIGVNAVDVDVAAFDLADEVDRATRKYLHDLIVHPGEYAGKSIQFPPPPENHKW